jgi:hypothetical protein
MDFMSIEQTLQNEIQESKKWIQVEKDDSTYKQDLRKRVELITWVFKIYILICEQVPRKFKYRVFC